MHIYNTSNIPIVTVLILHFLLFTATVQSLEGQDQMFMFQLAPSPTEWAKISSICLSIMINKYWPTFKYFGTKNHNSNQMAYYHVLFCKQ